MVDLWGNHWSSNFVEEINISIVWFFHQKICMSVCMYICICKCVCVCECVCVCACMYVRTYVYMFVCLSVCMSVPLYLCFSACLHVCMPVCLYVCMSVWTDGWMDGRTYGRICMYACVHLRMDGCMDACMYICKLRVCTCCFVLCWQINIPILPSMSSCLEQPLPLHRLICCCLTWPYGNSWISSNNNNNKKNKNKNKNKNKMSFGEAFLATDLVYGSFFFPLYLSTGSLFATNFVYGRLFCHEMPLQEVLLSQPESAGSVFAVKSSPRPTPSVTMAPPGVKKDRPAPT